MPNSNNQTIFISAGEASGDLLGADLARAIHQKNSEIRLIGMGGDRMRSAGVDIQFDSKLLSVVGLFEVISRLPRILHTLYQIKKYLQKTKPSLIILIDFPDTHFRIMKYAKKIGIPVLYYVSPQIWAWRSGRIHQLKKYVDHMAVLFSFEEKMYRDAGIPVTFVGHPLADMVKPTLSKKEAYDFFKLKAENPIITLLPGSRQSEMHYHLAIICESVKKIQQPLPQAQFVLVLANHFDEKKIRGEIPSHIKIIRDHFYDLLQISNAAIAASGTVTLEVALMQTPLCIIYKMHSITFWLAKKLIRLKQIGLCNIVLGKVVAREFIQENANAENIAFEMIKLISDQSYREKIKSDLSEIKNKLSIAPEKSSEKVACIALTVMRAHLRASDFVSL